MKFSNIKSLLAIFLGIAVYANTALSAEETNAVRSDTCEKLKDTQRPFVLLLNKNEKILDAIIHCAENAHISAASISGLGALQNPVLEYFSLKDKKYKDKKFQGVYELASLNGNLSLSDDKIFPHVHVVLSDSSYKTIAGHLKEALVGATAEITVTPLGEKLVRVPDATVGLNLISTQKK